MSDDTVVNHIARYHYGIHFQEKYDSKKHEEQDKIWDMVECEWKAYHQMRWYIHRVFSSMEWKAGVPETNKAQGDNISKADPVRYNWYQTITDRDQLSDIDTTIYYCTPETAPKRRSSGNTLFLSLKPSPSPISAQF